MDILLGLSLIIVVVGLIAVFLMGRLMKAFRNAAVVLTSPEVVAAAKQSRETGKPVWVGNKKVTANADGGHTVKWNRSR